MTEGDKKAFAETWRAALATYGREATTEMLRLAFGILRRFPIEDVQAGIAQHMNRSRFAPTPADIVSVIEARKPDGRPTADEAWALALTASDEEETVVWTREMAEASAAAMPILEAGDKVGARMAFKAAYDRFVDEARAANVPAKWEVSLGHDPARRQAAITKAVISGLVAHDRVAHLLSSPMNEAGQAIAGLLVGKVVETNNASFNERLSELRKMITEANEADERARAAKAEAKIAQDRARKEAAIKAAEQWQKERA